MKDLPPLRTNYSLIIHAIHSRMQFIRNKMEYSKGMDVNEFREINKVQFEKITTSIQNSHSYTINKSEIYDASAMFLHSIDWEVEKIKDMPDWKPKQKPDQP